MSFAMAYQQPQSGIPLARFFRRALFTHDVQQKNAAVQMGGEHYHATLCRGLAGLGPLDFWALVKLDFDVLITLFRLVLAAKLAQWETDSIQEKSA